jgi:hypothetical protein
VKHLSLILLAGICIFAQNEIHAGLQRDDFGFEEHLAHATNSQVWTQFVRYVPGRNLYILYYAAMYRTLGQKHANLHTLGLSLDLLNVALFWALLKRFKLPNIYCSMACGLFLVWPNHNETHFWTSAILMNLLSTALVLGAYLVARRRQWLAILIFALALFDYDQVFFMWIPLVIWLTLERQRVAAMIYWFVGFDSVHLLLRLFSPYSDGGRPMIRLSGIPKQILFSVYSNFAPVQRLPMASWWCLGGVAVIATLWIVLIAKDWQVRPIHPGPLLLGAAWWTCAYLPTWLWYISPRHNYLPSCGLMLIGVSFVGLLRKRTALVLLWLLFMRGAAISVEDGQQWLGREVGDAVGTQPHRPRRFQFPDPDALFRIKVLDDLRYCRLEELRAEFDLITPNPLAQAEVARHDLPDCPVPVQALLFRWHEGILPQTQRARL